MKIKFLLILIGVFSIESISFSQQQDLPNRMTSEEEVIMPNYLLNSSQRATQGITTPPNSPTRTIGEWEEVQGLVIGWTSFPSMLREIVRHAKEECRVYILAGNPQQVWNDLNANGIDTVNVTVLDEEFNTVWSRDYGPWSVYTDEVDTLLTIDWVYNRPRPDDDLVPEVIANVLNTPLYQTTSTEYRLVHCGGNFMTDGFGTGFSSNLVLDENQNHTEAEIDNIMNAFMGIDRYIKMPTLPYDGIHHIDMHMKLLNEETILMGEYPQGIADGPQIEANLLYVINNFNSVYGTPYKVVRIPMPKDTDHDAYPNAWNGEYWTYTNSTIVNKTVLVPTYNIPEDDIALDIYRDAMPGYNIIGINSKASIPSLGAIHCITKEVAAENPLLISHQELADTDDNINPYPVEAYIKHRSGIATTTLYYRTDETAPYDAVSMTPISGQNGFYIGYIPPQYNGTTVQYYIHAEAVSGKEQVRPMPAPDGYFHFDVFGDDPNTSNINNEENHNLMIGNIFPNPASAITCIPLNSEKGQHVSIRLFDVTGKLIQTVFEGELYAGQNYKFFDASLLSSGTYMVEISGEFGTKVQKVMAK
ncbi:MAG: agmatine deiminase family protein [Brumimicrobium sp.]